jgi:hypothetical protein
LVCFLKLVADVFGGGIWEFVDYVGRPSFLKRKLMGFGVHRHQSEFRIVLVDGAHSCILRISDLFLQYKKH